MSEEQIVTTEEKDWKAEAEKLAAEKENLNKALHEARLKSKEKEVPDVGSLKEEILKEVRMETRKATIDKQLADLVDEDKAKVTNALKRLNYDSSSDEDTLKAIEEARLLALGVSHAEKKARKSLAEKSAVQSASVSVQSSQVEEDEQNLSADEKNLLELFKGYAQK